MRTIVTILIHLIACIFRTRMYLQVEILALRHQLTAYQQSITAKETEGWFV